ncbi:MAG: hypothetical protein H6835_00285 [Planctomycetes bacterium]|nr:hypothetical protein [Planctomycetota bacterium]
MADPLSNAAPVGGVGGFPERPRDWSRREPPRGGVHKDVEHDEVSLHGAAQIARRLLRSRVLARTRQHLELGDDEVVPRFAEAVDAESLASFVGRLIGAQNQLAALRCDRWSSRELRQRLDAALRHGLEDAADLLLDDPVHGLAGAQVVADVLGAYAGMLGRLSDEA